MCGSTENGKWTCPPCTLLVSVHRELIRSLQSWHSWYENQQVGETLRSIDGRSYCLWDIDMFYAGRTGVADNMRLSIELCLYNNMLEREAAVAMGNKETSPVAIYATIGLTHMLTDASLGQLRGYDFDLVAERDRAQVVLLEQQKARDEAEECAA